MLDAWGDQVPHGWVTGDDELGRHTRFRRALRERGERYVLGGFCRKFYSGGREGAVAPVCGRDEAAREENSAAAVRPSFPSSTTSCRFLSMCMSSMPTSVAGAASNALHPNIGRVIRLTPLWSYSTMLLRYLTLRIAIAVPCSAL